MNQGNTVSCFGRELLFEGFCFALCDSRNYPYIFEGGLNRAKSVVKESKQKIKAQLKPE